MNAIEIECPECGAKPGQRCHTLTGKASPVSHAKRKRAAFEAAELRESETDGTTHLISQPTSKT
jgi:hypothetical protein